MIKMVEPSQYTSSGNDSDWKIIISSLLLDDEFCFSGGF